VQLLKRYSRRRRLAVLSVVTLAGLIIVVGLSGGCGAQRRPPALTPEERRLVASGPLPYAVSVIPWDSSTRALTYTEPLADLLRTSGVFRSVRLEATPSPGADLIVTSTGAYCNTAIIPLLTLISLGLIPTIFDDEDCVGLVLRRAASSSASDSVEMTFRYKGRVVMGWAAVVIGALPGWTHGSASRDTRYRDHFRLELLRHHTEIRRLAGR
jgi:hypothetical protein